MQWLTRNSVPLVRISLGFVFLAFGLLKFFPGDLFSREYNAPTLEGQYVVKDIVLLTSALVVALKQRGVEMVMVPHDDTESA